MSDFQCVIRSLPEFTKVYQTPSKYTNENRGNQRRKPKNPTNFELVG